jgi:hypothetical protein
MIPTQYQDLPGLRTVYAEPELRLAIAVAEVLIANSLGGGSSDGITESDVVDAIEASDNLSDLATSTKQDTGNVTLSTINGKLPSLGQALAAASTPVVLTAAQISTLTPLSTVTANLGTIGAAATAANQTTGNTTLTAISGKLNRTSIYATGTISSSGDNTVIAAPGASTYIYVTDLTIQNESVSSTTIIVKDSAAKMRVLGQNQGDGISKVYPVGGELKLEVNQPLVLNLSDANSVGYSVGYYIGA